MNCNGYILVHRKMLESLSMSDSWLCHLWMTILLRANWKTGYFAGTELKPGQFAFSRRNFAESMKVSRGKLDRGLETLQKAGQIKIKASQRFSVLTVCNWKGYQNPEGNDRATDRATDGAIYKKGRKKEGKKDSKSYPELFETFWTSYPRKESKGVALKGWPAALTATAQSKLIGDGESPESFLARRAADYAASVASTERRYVQLPASWLNAHGWENEIGSRVPTAEDLANWSPSG